MRARPTPSPSRVSCLVPSNAFRLSSRTNLARLASTRCGVRPNNPIAPVSLPARWCTFGHHLILCISSWCVLSCTQRRPNILTKRPHSRQKNAGVGGSRTYENVHLYENVSGCRPPFPFSAIRALMHACTFSCAALSSGPGCFGAKSCAAGISACTNRSLLEATSACTDAVLTCGNDANRV